VNIIFIDFYNSNINMNLACIVFHKRLSMILDCILYCDYGILNNDNGTGLAII
jgi:hypothetical protein